MRDNRGMISFGINPSPAEKNRDCCPPATVGRVTKLVLPQLQHHGTSEEVIHFFARANLARLVRYQLRLRNAVGSPFAWY